MRLYEGSVGNFKDDVITNRVSDKLAANFESHYKRKVSPSEYNSWNNSLNFLKNALDYSGLIDNQLVIEYELPYSTRRIDVLLFGKSADDKDNIVLMELKQWSEVEESKIEGNVITFISGAKREVAHPSLQVEGYHYDLKDFITVFEEKPPVDLSSCAYCHNYLKSRNKVLFAPQFEKYFKNFPVFSREDVQDLGLFLKERLDSGHGLDVFNRFILSPVMPSKRLLAYTKEIISKQRVFNLIDDQIAAYNAIIDRAGKLAALKTKSIILVKGGPGTGKSVIALEAMAELMRRGKVVFHATGSSAFTKTLRKILGRRVEKFFKFFFSFTKFKDDEIDVLICDEAHRIREHSNDYGVPFSLRSKNPQVEDLIRPAKLVIFFIDEHQVVRPKETGSVTLIKTAAEKFGAECFEFTLTAQFRCSGSDSYLLWLDDLFGIRDTGKRLLTPEDKMQFKIFDSPTALKKAIDEANRRNANSARIVAGFCWPWSAPSADGTLVKDVVIGDFQMPWEKKDEFWKWATDDSGMEQVGTVYTAQGFEFDYIGVIFSDDLIFDPVSQQWKVQPEKSFDEMLKRNNENMCRHLQNVYRVLMSRAHKGCYVYFVNKDTEKYFRSRIQFAADIEEPKDESFIDQIEKEINEKLKYVDYLPVYSLEAACGNFGEGRVVGEEGWVKVSGTKLSRNMFVSRVKGKSMEPRISDNSLCVFRAPVVGSRQNKIVLVQHNSISDPENGGRYTVKKYTSKKKEAPDETWEHEEITLIPLNPAFEPIRIPNSEEGGFIVVAEFIKTV